MAHVSHKLSSSLEGALAGGGDPATSPLYVFGPFLRLVVVAGVASVTFGASIWLAVLTVVTVSAMYRKVMIWVTDGSGGSGLSEEELGPWAVKVNAGITVVEYTLTFLVSIAALVTFIADRVPALDRPFAGVPLRTLVAIALTIFTGVIVNRGPKVTARAFGPATAAVLALLWVMIGATIWKRGLHLPTLDLAAFSPRYLRLTLGGYARILALMTGIEIFANLVAAYRGPARQRSALAFRSLLIVMGTTSLTMIVVGPAIHDLADPLDPNVSVFTQTLDRLLPGPLAYAGSLIGIAVLLSAAAASAQGLQNLALGLRYRHYVPASFGEKNRFEVAAKPVWLQVGVCVACFLVLGTREETYLALYAAGVFVLLSLTGWAAVKRLTRELRRAQSFKGGVSLAGTTLAALLTSGATLVIFEERFREGAWIYLLLIPVLYVAFSVVRRRLGPPLAVEERLGTIVACQPTAVSPAPAGRAAPLRNVLVPLDGSPHAEQALPIALAVANQFGSRVTLLSVLEDERTPDEVERAREYLALLAVQVRAQARDVELDVHQGEPVAKIGELARSGAVDLVAMTFDGRAPWRRLLGPGVTVGVIHQTTPPLIVVRPTEDWRSTRSRFARLLVLLDGSEVAEEVLEHVYSIAGAFGSHVVLLSVPEGSDSDEVSEHLGRYLEAIRAALAREGIMAKAIVEGSSPTQTILRVAESEDVDLIMLVSHGRGGVDRQRHVLLGSVADGVLQESRCPVFIVSAVAPIARSMSVDTEKSEIGSSSTHRGTTGA